MYWIRYIALLTWKRVIRPVLTPASSRDRHFGNCEREGKHTNVPKQKKALSHISHRWKTGLWWWLFEEENVLALHVWETTGRRKRVDFFLFLDFLRSPPFHPFRYWRGWFRREGGSVFSARTHTHTYTFGKGVLGKEKRVEGGDGDAISFSALVGGNSPILSTGKLPEWDCRNGTLPHNIYFGEFYIFPQIPRTPLSPFLPDIKYPPPPVLPLNPLPPLFPLGTDYWRCSHHRYLSLIKEEE